MQGLKEILTQVQNGERDFCPNGSDLAELRKFQEIAKRIIHAEENGYIQEAKCLKDYTYSEGQIKRIKINGGLTFDGEQFLKETETQECTAPQEDILEIKPNIAGVGVNINALWRRIRHKMVKKS